MALDGIFLHAICLELKRWVGSRVENIIQIARFDFVFELRLPNAKARLFVSSNPGCSRVYFIHKGNNFKNNKNNKKFSDFGLVLIERVQGARLVQTEQEGLDRVLFLEFEKAGEQAVDGKIVLAVEIIGKRSNMVLFQKNSRKIIDAARWLNDELLKQRPVEPGVLYCEVETQSKLNILNNDCDYVLKRLFLNSDFSLSRAIVETVEGVSPVVARELALNFEQKPLADFDETEKEELARVLNDFKKLVMLQRFSFFAFLEGDIPKEFCWFELKQFGNLLSTKEFSSASELLEFFYDEKFSVERLGQQCYNMAKQIKKEIERLSVKKNIKLKEFGELENFEKYRVYGDLLSSNLHIVEKGSLSVKLENFYSKGEEVEILLDSEKSPLQNAQAYYKKFSELKVKHQTLQNSILKLDDAISFLKTELNLLMGSKTQNEVLTIFKRLVKKGFLVK